MDYRDDIDSVSEFDELTEDKRLVLLEWCKSLQLIQTINRKHTSYGLKHLFEDDSDGFYITNGAFKGAMMKAGFKHQAASAKNWYFNVSEKSIKLIENRII